MWTAILEKTLCYANVMTNDTERPSFSGVVRTTNAARMGGLTRRRERESGVLSCDVPWLIADATRRGWVAGVCCLTPVASYAHFCSPAVKRGGRAMGLGAAMRAARGDVATTM